METVYRMDQNRSVQPPIVSGSEMRRSRTGAVTPYRDRQAPMHQSTQQMHTSQRMTHKDDEPPVADCDRTGMLQEQAPLANPYVPFQRNNPNRYATQRALSRGTLFPGLDLPLCGMVNADKPMTPLTKLMALQFAVTELGMYLDTHCDDKEAMMLFCDYVEKADAARKSFEAKYGPLTQSSTEKNWSWINDPWPWDFCQEG